MHFLGRSGSFSTLVFAYSSAPVLALLLLSSLALPALAYHGQVKPLVHARPVAAKPIVYAAVGKPIAIPTVGVCSTQTLMIHSFGNSAGTPFVAPYTPPACAFNSVIINFTAVSIGQQASRLAELYLTDTEVWRTSTAEPTAAGVSWHYIKDLSPYLALWKSPQTLIFELDNVISGGNTASYNVTLTATFFQNATAPVHADAVLPISARQGAAGQQSMFMVPTTKAALAYTSFPSNVVHATVSILASGQANEQYWYSNVLSSDTQTFHSTVGTLSGGGPFREVQLLIDGQLAGIAWPFPVIFPDGIAPGMWQPIVGIQAFDLAENEIDITPWLPLLTDGAQHSFTIQVMRLADSGGQGAATLTQVESFWAVTGKIFLFYGQGASYAHGPAPAINAIPPSINVTSAITTTATGLNATLSYSVSARRYFSLSSPLGTWTQTLWYTNNGVVSGGGLVQSLTQSTMGSSVATNALAPAFGSTVSFIYPLAINSTLARFATGSHGDASVSQGLILSDTGRPDVSLFSLVAGPAKMDINQIGNGHYSTVPGSTYSYGTLFQRVAATSYSTSFMLALQGINGSLYTTTTGTGTGTGTGTTCKLYHHHLVKAVGGPIHCS